MIQGRQPSTSDPKLVVLFSLTRVGTLGGAVETQSHHYRRCDAKPGQDFTDHKNLPLPKGRT